MILGAQLYTVRDFIQTEKDMDETFARIAKIGYTTVQVSGLAKWDYKAIRECCDKHGLKPVLTHTPQERVLYDTDAVIEEHNILGCDYIGIGSMPGRYRSSAWLERFPVDFKEPAKKIADSGKLLMYHNHHFEFAKVNGVTVLDYLMEAMTPEEMGFTLDTYWIQAGGGDVVAWIKKLAGRLPCVHLKDMEILDVNNTVNAVMAPVMEGSMNFEGILEALKANGDTKYILVEQDVCQESPFTCLEKSYNNLSKLGYK